MSSRKFPTGHISRTITIKKALNLIKDKILIEEFKTPSKLLQEEAGLLDEFGINNRFFGRYLTKTNNGRYSVCFDLFINQKESLKKFYKDIGYSLPRKQSKLISLIGGENSTEVIQYLNKEKRTV